MKKIMYRISILIFCGASFTLFGCSSVKPWQKGNLVKPQMAFDQDPLRTRFMHHAYESKEAASGGYGISVVGCGCK